VQAVDSRLQDLQRKQGTLQAHRTKVNAQQFEDGFLVEFLHFLQRLANDGFKQKVSGGLRDGASVTVEAGIGYNAICVNPQIDLDVIAA